jgi:hypothetical protein
MVYLYKKGNLDAVKEYLDSKLESFKEIYKEMNIEGYWTTFKSHLFNAMDQYISSVTHCCKQCSSTKSIAS